MAITRIAIGYAASAMHNQSDHGRIRRRDHSSPQSVLYSMSWYLMLSAIAFLLGAYRSVVQLTRQSSIQEALVKHPQIQSGERRNILYYNNGNDKPEGTATSTISGDKIDPKYLLAYQQSYGFFDDIPNNEWQKLQSIAQSSGKYEPRHQYDAKYMGNDDDDTYWNAMPNNIFYGRNYDPNFSCRFEVRVGGMGDGPKFVCDPHRIPRVAKLNSIVNLIDADRWSSNNAGQKSNKRNASDRCLVYSIGSGGNFRFEYGLQSLLGPENRCEIHVFDGTDYSSSMPKLLDIHFHPWGLRRDRGPNTNDDYSPDENAAYHMGNDMTSLKYLSLSQTIKTLGHSGRMIDVLKIDCEGCEWKTYVDWIRGTSGDGSIAIPPPRQVLVEMHASPAPYARDFFNSMREAGYVIFHKEPNLEGCHGECVEYAFLRLHPDFYE